MNSLQRQNGLTLVELLIASALGLLLMLGVTQLFVSSSDSFRMAESIGRIQESGRLAQDILGRTIRNADYWGCIDPANLDSVIDASDTTKFKEELHGFVPPNAVQFDIGDASSDAVAGTVVIGLKGARSSGVSIDPNKAITPFKIPVSSLTAGAFKAGGLALVTNCSTGVVFQLSGVDVSNQSIELDANGTGTPGNTVLTTGCTNGSSQANCFPEAYSEASIFAPFAETYYIYQDADGRRALVYEGFDSNGTVNRQELVSDVIDMQVQVGTGPADNNIVNNWQTLASGNLATVNSSYVKAIRVSLLVSSPEDRVAKKAQTACYPAWTDCSAGDNWKAADEFNADDRHYYRVYTSTYSIRNRLLDAN